LGSPAVSVVLPFKDSERFLEPALGSLVSQTLTDFEVIMVDNGSTDSSRKIARGFCENDSRFKLYQSGGGLVRALNSGLDHAQGRWVARFDSDDLCHPDRLLRQLEAAEENGEKTVVSCRVRSFPDSAVSSGYRQYESWINDLESSEDIQHNLFVESPVPHPTAFYGREAVIEVGGYSDCGLPEDYELWLRLWSRGFRFIRVPKTLLAWRERPDRFSRVSSAYSLTSFYRAKSKYLGLVPCLQGKRVFVAGAGQTARRLGKHIQREGFVIEAFLSPVPVREGQLLRGCPVIDISRWKNTQELPIVVATRIPGAAQAVQGYLESLGLVNWKNFVLCS
jgi:glycosyltransferase involved in cell wall biosynthesis